MRSYRSSPARFRSYRGPAPTYGYYREPPLYGGYYGYYREPPLVGYYGYYREPPLFGDYGDDPEFDIADASAAAGRQASRDLYAKYQSACKGVRVLQRLRKTKLSPLAEERMLEERIAGLPQLFKDLAALGRRALTMTNKEYKKEYAKLVTRLGYPPDIYLGRLDTALAEARCELSFSKWRFAASCDGMEVDDPQYISRRVADHYAQTELGRTLGSLKVTCKGGGRWCDVDYPNDITIRVGFAKVPDSLIAVQVAPRLGPQREYTYSCFKRNLILH
jgi:hypothetical protein